MSTETPERPLASTEQVEFHSWLVKSPALHRFPLDAPVVVRGSPPRGLGVVLLDAGGSSPVGVLVVSDLVPVFSSKTRARVRLNLQRDQGVGAAIRYIHTWLPTALAHRDLGKITLTWQLGRNLDPGQRVLLAHYLTLAAACAASESPCEP